MTKINSMFGTDPIRVVDEPSDLRARLQKIIHDDKRGGFEKFSEAVLLKRRLLNLTVTQPGRIKHKQILEEIASSAGIRVQKRPPNGKAQS